MTRSVTIVNIADLPLRTSPGVGREGSAASKRFPLDTGVRGVKLELSWRRYNKGYGTPEHYSGLKLHGVTIHHRRSFAPIRDILNGAEPSLALDVAADQA